WLRRAPSAPTTRRCPATCAAVRCCAANSPMPSSREASVVRSASCASRAPSTRAGSERPGWTSWGWVALVRRVAAAGGSIGCAGIASARVSRRPRPRPPRWRLRSVRVAATPGRMRRRFPPASGPRRASRATSAPSRPTPTSRCSARST
ncbi:MAG: hypothetical protein AVDCRST_MAG65-1514, partial [uncultured Solirubrobacteraceae bacterium]